ncbi:MAG: LPS export ABC transporter periplasmic protein LptC [Pseudomonadota bacterium]
MNAVGAKELPTFMMGPHVSQEAKRVHRHSVLVRQLRLAVPALAAGLAMTYAFSASPPRVDPEFAKQFSGLDADAEGLKLASPRYSGEDLSGKPFEVAAATATRAGGDPDKMDLENPQARRISETGAVMTVRADDGLYDQDAQVMDLSSNVEMAQGSGEGTFILNTEAATMNLDSQVLQSNAEVTGAGEQGTLRADRGTLYQNEDRLVLEGGVKIILAPREPKSESDDGSETTGGS